jgi:hypothetical protein
MLASQIGNSILQGMGVKSRKIMAKRLDDDFDKVCEKYGIKDHMSIEECKNLITNLGFITFE